MTPLASLSDLSLEERQTLVRTNASIANIIRSALDTVLSGKEEVLYNSFTRAGRESLFSRINESGISFMALCWDFLSDVLIFGDGYVSYTYVDEDTSLTHLSPLNISVDGGGSLETTVYTYFSEAENSKFAWDMMIRVSMEVLLSGDYRLYGWLPTGDVLLEDFPTVEALLNKSINILLEILLGEKYGFRQAS